MRPASSSKSHEGKTNIQTGAFPATIWAELDRLKGAASTVQQDVYDSLIRRYWKPVYRFILCKGYGEQKGEELVEDFFAFCFQENVFAKADPARGRFRNFLLKSLQNFVANEERRAGAIKRNPPGGLVSIHDLATSQDWPRQLADTKKPEEEFDETWFRELLVCALEALKQNCLASRMDVHYEILMARVGRPLLEGSEPVSYKQLAKKYGLTEKGASNFCITARKALRRALDAEIRLYASSEEEVEAEIREIFQFVSRS